jgi:hypothetical protein
LPSTKDLQPDKCFRVLAYAPSGKGKTFGALTFPRPVVLDFDKGIRTARNPAFVAKYGVLDIPYEQFEEKDFTKSGVVKVHKAFDEAFLFYEKMMKTPELHDSFDTWVIDSATTLSEKALNKALIFMGQEKLSQTQATAVAQGVVIPKRQDYGAERSLVEQFISMVLSSDKNVVVLCHEKEIYEGDVVIGRVPLLTGKGVEAVCLLFDEVYHIEVKKQGADTKYVLMSELPGRNYAKSRSGVPNGTDWNWPSIKAELNRISISQATLSAASAATK